MSTILEMIRLSTTDSSELTVVSAKQGDNLSSVLPIKIYNDQTEIDLSQYDAVSFNGIKSDKSAVLYLSTDKDGCLKLSDNTIYLTLTSALLAVDGTCECEISLYKGEEIRSAYGFNIYVYKSPSDINRYYESDFNSVKNIVKDMQTYSEAAKASAEDAKTSEDNAKENADASLSNAVSAKDSADRSAESAQTAENSAQTAASASGLAAASADEAAESALSASSHAATAATKANESASSAASSMEYADYSKSYAMGSNNTVRENDEVDNARYYYQQLKQISQGNTGLIPMGTVPFLALSLEENQVSKYMFNISESFTTDDTFKEGSGYVYPAGTNVYRTNDGYWDCMAGISVAGVKGDTESDYRQGFVNISKANIGLGNVPNVTTNDQTPAFSQALSRANIESGETLSVLLGKIMKWFADSKEVAFTGSYNSLSDQPVIPTKTSQLTNDSGFKTTDTNTWRGIQNNLTSDSTTDSLSAAQGKVLKGLVDTKAAASHSHNYAGSSSAGGAATSALACTGNSATATTAAKWNGYAMRTGTSGAAGYITFQI